MARLEKFLNGDFRGQTTGPDNSPLYLPNLPDPTEALFVLQAVSRRLHLPLDFGAEIPAERRAQLEALGQRYIAEKRLRP
jgi:hypothetical protein